MATFSRTGQASRTGGGGTIVVEGIDALVQEFTREAAQVEDRAKDVVVEYAEEAAEVMRDLVPVRDGDVRDSITADKHWLRTGGAIGADAGPDPRANNQAFVARYLEHGTVKMSPRPFVGPSADRVLPRFARAIRDISKL